MVKSLIGKMIKDVVTWPPTSWATSGESNLLLYPEHAIIESALVVKDGISLSAQQSGKSFTTHIDYFGAEERTLLANALNQSAGKSVNHAGNSII